MIIFLVLSLVVFYGFIYLSDYGFLFVLI